MPRDHQIIVDGKPKGEAFYRNSRWWWRRPNGSVEAMPRRATLHSVLEWARKCCNGKSVEVK